MPKRDIIRRDLKVSAANIRELEDGKKTILGFIPYNSRSEYMGFYECITPTAFNKTLADGADVRALMNHDSNKLLGRVKNGTLRLESQEDGLHIECDLPDTSYARDVYQLIKEGYNTGLSFGFSIIQEDVHIERDDKGMTDVEVHYLREVKLYEVSFAVTFPAYEETNSQARSLLDIDDKELEDLGDKELTDEEIERLCKIKKRIDEIIPDDKKEKPAPVDEDTSAEEDSTEDDEEERQLDEILEEIRTLRRKQNV